MSNIKDLIIIGSGPAGYSAAIYAKRSGLNVALIKGLTPNGQLMLTTEVENYPGFKSIQGPILMQTMEEQASSLGVELINDYIKEVDFANKPYKLQGELGLYETKTVIIATGSSAKWLGRDDEEYFSGFGVSACATCDGFFFKDQVVAVIGGGNTAATEALHLSHIAKKVYLIHRRDTLRSEQIITEKILNTKNIEVLWNNEIEEIKGKDDPKEVTHLVVRNNKDNSINSLELSGIFIAIGHSPNTLFLKNQVLMDEAGYIVAKPDSMEVMKNENEVLEGIYVAGDVRKGNFKQAVVSAGNGCTAALQAQEYLLKNS